MGIKDYLAIENIDIKKKNEGKFTKYCKQNGYDGVTDECIAKGLKSKDPHIRKMALFAKNAKKWNHDKQKKKTK